MLQSLYSIYRKVNYLSLDIVLGAVLSASLTTYVFPYDITWWYYLVLAASVWVIYTLDHLIDSQRNKEIAVSPRHLYYYSNFSVIAWSVGFTMVGIGVLLLLFAPLKLLVFGIFLGGISFIYLGLVFLVKNPSVWLPKELIVALIYTVGIWGFPIILQEGMGLKYLLFPIFFFLVVFFVLVFYSYVDLKEDLADHFYGLLSILSRTKSEQLLMLLLLSEVIVFLFIDVLFPWSELRLLLIIYFIMMLMTFVLFYYKNKLKNRGYYRMLGETIFFIPGIVLGISEILTFAKNLL